MRHIWLIPAALAFVPAASATAKTKPLAAARQALEDAIDEAKEDRDCKKAIGKDLEDAADELEGKPSAKALKKIDKLLGELEKDAGDCPKAVKRSLSEARDAIDDAIDDTQADDEEEDRPAKKEKPKAKTGWANDPEAAEEACKAKKGAACYDLAEMHANGNGVDKNETIAVEYYEKACSMKFIAGCNAMGNVHFNGWGGAEVDHEQAAAMYKKACDGGHGDACYSLGYMNEQGQGAKKNDKKALGFYEKSCTRNSGLGCFAVGNAHKNGFAGLDASVKAAIGFFEKACNLHHGEACYQMSELYREGRSVGRSEGQQHTYLAYACTYGHQASCGRVDQGKVLKEGLNQLTKGLESFQNIGF